jgi:hypothetical protein
VVDPDSIPFYEIQVIPLPKHETLHNIVHHKSQQLACSCFSACGGSSSSSLATLLSVSTSIYRGFRHYLQPENPYIWYQHEWILGVLEMGLLLLFAFRSLHLAILVVRKNPWHGSFIEHVWSSEQVTATLYTHCKVDLEVPCANLGRP